MLESSEKLNNQAIRLASHGEYAEAIACFKRAITVEKQNYLLWFNLGLTYRDSGDMENARSALEHAYQYNPTNQEVIETLALICFFTGEMEDAVNYCRNGLSEMPANPHLWNTLGVVYFNTSQYEEAGTCFEHALTINPYYYDALYNLRDTYEELGNFSGAAECNRRLKDTPGGH